MLPWAAEPMSILRLDRVRREVGTFVILDDVTAAIAVDDRIGLVGPNGAGKTTLLRLAAGRDEPDSGEVHRKRGLTIGLLAQESHFDAAFMAAPDLRAAVRHGAAHLETMAAALHEMEQAGRVEEAAYSDLQHQFEILGGYTLDLRVDEALSGLGFTRDEWTKPPTALSGGEQTRATLARLVIAQPDLLFLDEPTNHLDIAAIEWLEEHLRRRHGALLVASHDRAFLDATVGRIGGDRFAAVLPPRADDVVHEAVERRALGGDAPRPVLPVFVKRNRGAGLQGAADPADEALRVPDEGGGPAAPQPVGRAGRQRPVEVRFEDLDLRQLPSPAFGLQPVHETAGPVDRDDAPGWPDDFGELDGRISRAAAKVDDRLALPKPRAAPGARGMGAPDAVLKPEPADLVVVRTQQVVVLGHAAPSHAAPSVCHPFLARESNDEVAREKMAA